MTRAPAGTRVEPTAREGVGWSSLFSAAFMQSRNAMVLLDADRRHVDVNGAYVKLVGHPRGELIGRRVQDLVAGPHLSERTWAADLAQGRFTGETDLLCADGTRVAVQFAATVEVVTGRRLVLFVVLTTSRWGRAFRRGPDVEADATPAPLSNRGFAPSRAGSAGSGLISWWTRPTPWRRRVTTSTSLTGSGVTGWSPGWCWAHSGSSPWRPEWDSARRFPPPRRSTSRRRP